MFASKGFEKGYFLLNYRGKILFVEPVDIPDTKERGLGEITFCLQKMFVTIQLKILCSPG